MEKRINLGFMLGFTGGFINLLNALLGGYALAANLSGPENSVFFSGTLVIAIILIALPLINFAGACICRRSAAGRALMYVTGLLLLILFIGSLSGLFSSAPKVYAAGIPAYLIVYCAIIIAAECLSVSAAAILSVPAGKEQAPEYGGILGVFRRDELKEKPEDEFHAVHRLYCLPADDSETETSRETCTKQDDTK